MMGTARAKIVDGRGVWAALGLLATLACSPGVGRDPVFPDATVRAEAGVPDTGPRDAGTRDAGPVDVPVFVPDAGPPPAFVFTGVFGVLNDPAPLFAREVQGRLHVVVSGFPYTYIGTIDEAGVIDLTSSEQRASGCPESSIRGTYSRSDTLFDVTHATCNAQGQPVQGQLRGGFVEDFDPVLSGEYDVVMEVVTDIANCFGLGPVNETGRWAVSALSDRSLSVFVADDPVGPPAAYFGRATQDRASFTAAHHLDAVSNGPQVSMQGVFQQVTANDPVRILGTRDVFVPASGCTFSVRYEGTRVVAP